jgi:hypothetical protein
VRRDDANQDQQFFHERAHSNSPVARTVGAAFLAAMETIHGGYWKSSSHVAITTIADFIEYGSAQAKSELTSAR